MANLYGRHGRIRRRCAETRGPRGCLPQALGDAGYYGYPAGRADRVPRLTAAAIWGPHGTTVKAFRRDVTPLVPVLVAVSVRALSVAVAVALTVSVYVVGDTNVGALS